MKVIIPVAGIGKRLRPHTHTTPKVLIKVAGKTIIEYILDEIINFDEIDEFIFIVGYLGEQIENFIKRKYNSLKKFRFINQEAQLGLGHAIYLASDYVKDNEPVIIILGDTIFKLDFKELIKSNKNLIAVKEVNNPKRFGIVFLKDSKTEIKKLVEKPDKPESNLAIVGIYYIKDSNKLFEKLDYIIKNDIKTNNEYQLTDGLQKMLEEGVVIEAFRIEDWYDCGKPETLLKTNKILLKEYGNNLKIEGSIIIPPVYISESAKIIKSIIGPNVSIGDDVFIEDSIISNSIINDEATVRNLLLRDSIIGRDVEVNGVYRTLNIGDSSEVNLG